MKRALLISVIVLLLLPVVAHATAQIQFERLRYDFGPVKQGEMLQYVFNFSNTGNKDLIIEKIVPS